MPSWEPGVQHCPTCGLGFTWPRPGRQARKEAFSPADPIRPLPRWRRFLKHLLLLSLHSQAGILLRLRRASGRAVDVGCGEGHYLRALSVEGWEAVGIEYDAGRAHNARLRSHRPVLLADAQELPLGSGTQSLVTLWHVLEHVSDPRQALAEAYRVLMSGGWLLLEVPNRKAFQARVAGRRWLHWHLQHHYWHFDHYTLRHLLTATGFRDVRVLSWPNAPGWVDTWGCSRFWRWGGWLLDVLPAIPGRGGVLRVEARKR